MKVLCECWRKSDTCIACYMANLEDWNQIHAIAMNAEAQRRLEEDLRFLESINVWHLVNLRSTPPPPSHGLYRYGDGLDIITPSTEQPAYPSNLYHNQYPQHHHANSSIYLQGNRYLTPPPTPSVADLNHNHRQQRLQSPGYGTSLPYPDLIIHTRELSPPAPLYFPQKPTDISHTTTALIVNEKQPDEAKRSPSIIKKNNFNYSKEDNSCVIQNLALKDNSRLSNVTWIPKEPHDYDGDEAIRIASKEGTPSDEKKSVKFTADTIFVERDMNSPFWKAFAERRRQRRIHRQRKQLNAQIESASYQPSLVEIVRSAFTKSPSKDANGNCTKRKQTKGEVLVYDNSSQVPEHYTTQYVYSTPVTSKKSSKFLKMLTCQCCSATPTL